MLTMSPPSAQAQTFYYRLDTGGLSAAVPAMPAEPSNPGNPTAPTNPPLGDIGLTAVGVVAKTGRSFSTPAPTTTDAQAGRRFFTEFDLASVGLSLDGTTGIVQGSVVELGTITVDISVIDDTGRTTKKFIDIEIVPRMNVSVAGSTPVQPESAMVPIKVETSNTYGAVSWDPVDPGVLPPGVVFNASLGQFEGTPTTPGTYGPISVTGRDSLGDTATTSTTIVVEVVAAEEMAHLDLGDWHTCALTSTHGVKCWGRNDRGQLGNNSTTDSPKPVDVSGATSNVSAIAIGSFSNCLITDVGGAKCWGSGIDGQIGNGSNSNQSTPVDVVGLPSKVVQIAKSDGNGYSGHACAVMDTGRIMCWGSNAFGQLGNGETATAQSTPVAVSGITDALAVTVGSRHSCAISKSEGVKCWGQNNSGQLGNGDKTNKSVPVNVVGLATGAVALSAGGDNTTRISTCAVTSNGGVKCWGSNADGQLGDGTTITSSVPVDVKDLTSFAVSVHIGNRHACASMTSGEVACWGWNASGQIGNGTQISALRPVLVKNIPTGAAATATGYQHSCAVMTDRQVYCWGNNQYGQLGDETTTMRLSPVQAKLGF